MTLEHSYFISLIISTAQSHAQVSGQHREDAQMLTPGFLESAYLVNPSTRRACYSVVVRWITK